MKLQMISIFFIWLLVSHEGITLGARIHEGIRMQNNMVLENPNVSPEELVDAMDDSNEPK